MYDSKNKRILWLIAARSGSKGIPNKNIKLLNNKPLLAYRIETAVAIGNREDVWISTDSEEYAAIAQKWGGMVHFIRPAHLATDEASSSDVVLHAMEYAKVKGMVYDGIGLLEPTSPFVKTQSLQNAVNLLLADTNAENIVAVRKSLPNTTFIQEESFYLDKIAENIKLNATARRQDAKKEITPSGGFYIAKWSAFLENKTFYTNKTIPYELQGGEELEIDEPIDFTWAEFMIENQLV